MFGTMHYTNFEALMEGPLRDLLMAQDYCITKAYDDAISNVETRQYLVSDDLAHCRINSASVPNPVELEMTDLYQRLQACEYRFADALFLVVESRADHELSPSGSDDESLKTLKDKVETACKVGSFKSAQARP